MEKKALITALNEALAQEHACYIRYSTHAALVTGLSAEAVAVRFHEIADDEAEHAKELRDRIVALGGTPTVAVDAVEQATEIKKMLAINIKDERKAIAMYQKIFKQLDHRDVMLYETLEDIIRDEQEHLEELQRLAG